MVVVQGNGIVYVDGERVGTVKQMTVERHLNEPTYACITTYSKTFELTGWAAERAAAAIWNLDEWYRLNKLRKLLQEAMMREFAWRKGRRKGRKS